jgi:squalene-associated FAD-dependent desaturase
MACCTNLADFCRRVGIAELFRRDSSLAFLGPQKTVSWLRSGRIPPPFHLTESFLGARYLTWSDKLRIGYGMVHLAIGGGERLGESFADWLRRHRQSARTMELFWSTVLVSTLNEKLDQMDCGHARKVFVDGLLSTKTGFQIELPLVPLGELYGSRLEHWLREHQVQVRLTTGVRKIDCDEEGTLRGVLLRTGEPISADFVILAVPFDRVPALLGTSLATTIPALRVAESLQSSPITGIHLWFDRPVCPFDHVVTPGRLVQWVFNHTAIQGRTAFRSPASEFSQDDASNREGQYLQVVISASYGLLHLDNPAIRDAVLVDLASIWPDVQEARLLRWRVVTEHGATFAVRPGVDRFRPPQRTPIDGFFVAGDWTDTGWPATMEGAVRSGYLAAEGILRDLDHPSRLVRPDLKRGRLARWLLGYSTEAADGFRPVMPRSNLVPPDSYYSPRHQPRSGSEPER